MLTRLWCLFGVCRCPDAAAAAGAPPPSSGCGRCHSCLNPHLEHACQLVTTKAEPQRPQLQQELPLQEPGLLPALKDEGVNTQDGPSASLPRHAGWLACPASALHPGLSPSCLSPCQCAPPTRGLLPPADVALLGLWCRLSSQATSGKAQGDGEVEILGDADAPAAMAAKMRARVTGGAWLAEQSSLWVERLVVCGRERVSRVERLGPYAADWLIGMHVPPWSSGDTSLCCWAAGPPSHRFPAAAAAAEAKKATPTLPVGTRPSSELSKLAGQGPGGTRIMPPQLLARLKASRQPMWVHERLLPLWLVREYEERVQREAANAVAKDAVARSRALAQDATPSTKLAAQAAVRQAVAAAAAADACGVCGSSQGDRPEQDGSWVPCDICSRWFHATCVKLPAEDILSMAEDDAWHCPGCAEMMRRQERAARARQQ